MQTDRYTYVFFVGAGGIGMSALARFFMRLGKRVAGYDRTASPLTAQLRAEGMQIVFEDDASLLPAGFRDPKKALVVITPAISAANSFLKYFRQNGFEVHKRAEILGTITRNYKTIAVAGTHGKTTVSTMIAHLLQVSAKKSLAILGGISKNYQSNFLWNDDPEFVVTEADEFDRSFLQLNPQMAVITAADPDHLDIYGTHDALIGAFGEFAGQVSADGMLLTRKTVRINRKNLKVKDSFTYALDDENADIFAKNLKVAQGRMYFDMITPQGRLNGLEMQPGGRMNVENALAAVFTAMQAGVTEQEIRTGLAGFKGILRRFDIRLNHAEIAYADDYAHHPEEIRALVEAARSTWPGRRITGVFQPHLYSRTRDFADGFAHSLSLLDEVILLPVYPAREEPIPGVSSQMILDRIESSNKMLLPKDGLLKYLGGHQVEMLLTIGAGDIDRLVEPIKKLLEEKYIKTARS